MSLQIRITPDTMRDRAQEYSREKERFDGVIQEMDTLLNKLQEEWEGESSRAYAEKFEQLKPGFVEASDLVQKISNNLNTIADSVESTDNSIAGKFRS